MTVLILSLHLITSSTLGFKPTVWFSRWLLQILSLSVIKRASLPVNLLPGPFDRESLSQYRLPTSCTQSPSHRHHKLTFLFVWHNRCNHIVLSLVNDSLTTMASKEAYIWLARDLYLSTKPGNSVGYRGRCLRERHILPVRPTKLGGVVEEKRMYLIQ